ncbi:hypothetical protein CW362_38885 [Streptomyces populi]|uniref:Uncharacterized protein n=1 Tax=Streptomyces populi TaxID=2058924 RepID=A0A2I0SCS9_9ACTN|nr:hypothetical protein [Streptomyces populi]PKT67741.1 hypothetical protein CW362_38885 [Streptomyces populi]
MRLSHRFAPVFAAVALVMAVPHDAMPHPRAEDVGGGSWPPGIETARRAAVPQPFGAECRTTVTGSHVVAYCHNPYVGTDRVALHVECARWWDIDGDSVPVDVGPAMTVRLTGRCWKEIRTVWITHGE